MPFKKGISANPVGRPKKLLANQKKQKIKETFELLVEENLAQLRHDIADMPPKDRVAFFMRCTEYIMPKLSRCKPPQEPDKFKPMLRKWVITPVKSSHENEIPDE